MSMKHCEKGQAVLEGLMSVIILLILTYGAIEVFRLITFKSVLHVVTAEAAQQMSQYHLFLEREGFIKAQKASHQSEITSLEKNVRIQMQFYLDGFATAKHSLQKKSLTSVARFVDLERHKMTVKVEFDKHKNRGGVYVQTEVCFPVFLASVFEKSAERPNRSDLFDSPFEMDIGQKPPSEERDCKGIFLGTEKGKGASLYFKVSTSAYFPWPSSSNIFLKGVPEPSEKNGEAEGLLGLDTHDSFVSQLFALPSPFASFDSVHFDHADELLNRFSDPEVLKSGKEELSSEHYEALVEMKNNVNGLSLRGFSSQISTHLGLFGKYEWSPERSSHERVRGAINAHDREPTERFSVEDFKGSFQRKEQH